MMSLMLRSIVIHLVVILVSSLPYLFKCMRYGTFDVRSASAEERRVLEEEQRRERREMRGTPAAPVKKTVKKPAEAKTEEPSKTESRPTAEAPLESAPRAEPEDSNLNVDEDFGL